MTPAEVVERSRKRFERKEQKRRHSAATRRRCEAVVWNKGPHRCEEWAGFVRDGRRVCFGHYHSERTAFDAEGARAAWMAYRARWMPEYEVERAPDFAGEG